MELDELKRVWEKVDGKLDASMRLNTRVLHESVLGKARTALNRLLHLLQIELLLLLGVALWLGSFLGEQVSEMRFLIPGATLQAGVVLLVIACVRQIATLSRIDYDAPIVAIQKRLEILRIERIRAAKWTLLLAPLAWTPLSIVLGESLLDVDVCATFGSAWLGANLFFGLLVIVGGVWASRHFAVRIQRSSLSRRLLRDVAGHNLAAATGFLHSLEQFEEEESGARKG